MCEFLFYIGSWLIAIIKGTGAVLFGTAMLGWYLLILQLLGIMGFKINLPVGDLSQGWTSIKDCKA